MPIEITKEQQDIISLLQKQNSPITAEFISCHLKVGKKKIQKSLLFLFNKKVLDLDGKGGVFLSDYLKKYFEEN